MPVAGGLAGGVCTIGVFCTGPDGGAVGGVRTLSKASTQTAAVARPPALAQRQKRTLFHSGTAAGGAGLCTPDAGTACNGVSKPSAWRTRVELVGRCHRGDFFQQRRQMFLPLRHCLRELRIGGDALLHGQTVVGAEQAQHILAGQHVAGWFLVDGEGRAHRSRHALSLARPRRIQLLTVPIGVSVRSASSS